MEIKKDIYPRTAREREKCLVPVEGATGAGGGKLTEEFLLCLVLCKDRNIRHGPLPAV